MLGGTSVFLILVCCLYCFRYNLFLGDGRFLPTLKKWLMASWLVIMHLCSGASCWSTALGVGYGVLVGFFFPYDFGRLMIVSLFFCFQTLEGFRLRACFDLSGATVTS